MNQDTGERIIQWGVIDRAGHVAQCAGEQDARDYQAAHGGELVSRVTIRVGWWQPPAREAHPPERSAIPGSD